MKKILLSLIIVLALMCTVLPMTVLATGSTVNVDTKEEFLSALSDDTVTVINIKADMDLTDIPASAAKVFDVSGRTIDLGGNTIKANNMAVIYQGTDFVIQNGIFDANGGSYALWIGDTGYTNNVVVQGVATVGGINVYNAENVMLRDVNMTGSQYYAVWCDEHAQVIIESGEFQTQGNAVLGVADGNVDSSLTIENGNFHTNGKPLVLEDKYYREPPVIRGGTFDCSAKKYVADSLKYERNENGIYTYYPTLQEAIDGAGADTVITAVDSPAADDDVYMATLVYNDGSGMSIQMAGNADGEINLPAIGRSGYIFLGWTDESDTLIAVDQPYKLTANKTLTGQWKKLTKVKTEAKAATCAENGNIEYWYCPELNAYFRDEALTETVAFEDTIIPSTAHAETEMINVKAATCTQAGYTGDKACKACGTILEYGKTVEKLAHTFKDGRCSVCGAADTNVSAVSGQNVPNTGDANHTLWFVLLAVSGFAIAGMALYSKMKTNK